MKTADKPLPPTAVALLLAIGASGGSMDYRDPRMSTPGLTALRHRGLAGVRRNLGSAEVALTETGRGAYAALAAMEDRR